MTYAEKYEELRSKGYPPYDAAVTANAYARRDEPAEDAASFRPGEFDPEGDWNV